MTSKKSRNKSICETLIFIVDCNNCIRFYYCSLIFENWKVFSFYVCACVPVRACILIYAHIAGSTPQAASFLARVAPPIRSTQSLWPSGGRIGVQLFTTALSRPNQTPHSFCKVSEGAAKVVHFWHENSFLLFIELNLPLVKIQEVNGST